MPSGITARYLARFAIVCLAALPAGIAAQEGPVPLTRAQAVEMAVSRGARLGVARADTTAAAAALVTARAFPDPSLAASYSKSVPQYHVSLELPFEYPWIRGARIGAASAARRAAGYRFQFERAAAALDADTTYTRVLAARARAALSRRNAEDADTLRHMAASRRDAGDASDLDVELATVNAGQQANVAVGDSLEYLSTVLDLQVLLGLTARDVVLQPTDSLGAPPAGPPGDAGVDTLGIPVGGAAATRQAPGPIGTRSAPITAQPTPRGGSASPTNPGAPSGATSTPTAAGGSSSGPAPAPSAAPLSVAAAQASVESANLGLRAEQRGLWGAPALSAGFETHDPTGSEPGILPTFGVTLPLPLFSRNRGPILQARAEQQRARAELALAESESRAAIARALRTRDLALARVARDRALVASAQRVASMSRTAYREGASSLPNVLQAQRDARDVVAQYVDDLAAAWIATATLRVVTLTPASPSAPAR